MISPAHLQQWAGHDRSIDRCWVHLVEGADMPRRTSAEVIADLERKLAEAKATEEQKTEAERVKEAERVTTKITSLEARLEKAKVNEQAAIDKRIALEMEIAELKSTEQPTLPVQDETKIKAKSGAA